MTRQEFNACFDSKEDAQSWANLYAGWRAALERAEREWANFIAESGDTPALRKTREYRHWRDLAAETLLTEAPEINDDILRALQTICWQTKAIFGTEPPIVRMVMDELECRGHFPEFVTLPDWFTKPLRKKTRDAR